MRDYHMCRRDRRQPTKKKNLVRQLPAPNSRVNMCHIENFSPWERVSPYSCISTVHTKEPKRNRGSGPYISARVSIVCPRELVAQHKSHHQGVGPPLGSSLVVLNWTRSNRHYQHSAHLAHEVLRSSCCGTETIFVKTFTSLTFVNF